MKNLLIVLMAFALSSCAWFGTKNPHTDGLVIPPNTIEVETPTAVEDVRG